MGFITRNRTRKFYSSFKGTSSNPSRYFRSDMKNKMLLSTSLVSNSTPASNLPCSGPGLHQRTCPVSEMAKSASRAERFNSNPSSTVRWSRSRIPDIDTSWTSRISRALFPAWTANSTPPLIGFSSFRLWRRRSSGTGFFCSLMLAPASTLCVVGRPRSWPCIGCGFGV